MGSLAPGFSFIVTSVATESTRTLVVSIGLSSCSCVGELFFLGIINPRITISAITPISPTLSSSGTIPTISLSWSFTSSICIPISSYNIYQNGQIINNVPFTTTSITILLLPSFPTLKGSFL